MKQHITVICDCWLYTGDIYGLFSLIFNCMMDVLYGNRSNKAVVQEYEYQWVSIQNIWAKLLYIFLPFCAALRNRIFCYEIWPSWEKETFEYKLIINKVKLYISFLWALNALKSKQFHLKNFECTFKIKLETVKLKRFVARDFGFITTFYQKKVPFTVGKLTRISF